MDIVAAERKTDVQAMTDRRILAIQAECQSLPDGDRMDEVSAS